ncbi:hypothetical protein WOLCODRAFT_60854, partial [Wolfiporia cocos MD-104 SS10]
HFFQVVEQLGILHKIGMVTLDNASNCGTMMEELEQLLHEKSIHFEHDGNYIRLESYCNALHADPVMQTCSLVRVCHASQQHQEDLNNAVVQGNLDKLFGEYPLPEAHLLHDVTTCWSSTYLMIDRALELYPVSLFDLIISRILSVHRLSVLGDVRKFLRMPHMVQEVLSAQQTPTLSMALPGYEKLILVLKLLKQHLPRIAHAIDASVDKLEEYLSKTQVTRIYAIALIINSTMKFDLIETHWAPSECTDAWEWLC